MRWIRGIVLGWSGMTAACGPIAAPQGSSATDGSTGDVEDASTGEAGSSTGSPNGSGVSTGVVTTVGGEETGFDPAPDVGGGTDSEGDASQACTTEHCTTTCMTTVEHEAEDGSVCACDVAQYPPDYTRCDLGQPCGDDRLCTLQAVRYGIVGNYRLEEGVGEDHYRLEIDVLGEGRARVHESGWTYDCCGGAYGNAFGTFFHPQLVVRIDDPMWTQCLVDGAPDFEAIPDCLRPENLLVGTCEGGLLDECPAPPGLVPAVSCAQTCPMAEDRVCDEPGGTGLCDEGCDPLDCSCPEDVEGQCDEHHVDADGSCPVRSDADDCG